MKVVMVYALVPESRCKSINSSWAIRSLLNRLMHSTGCLEFETWAVFSTFTRLPTPKYVAFQNFTKYLTIFSFICTTVKSLTESMIDFGITTYQYFAFLWASEHSYLSKLPFFSKTFFQFGKPPLAKHLSAFVNL